MANATDPRHNIHLPDSDGAIILMLGAIVFMTFALGLVAQLCDTSPIFLLRRKQFYYYEDHDEEAYRYDPGEPALNHKMTDLEAGTDTMPQPPRPSIPHRPSATRYGSINQHVVDVNGIRKMVLTVDQDRHGRILPGDAARDDYAAWYELWRQRQRGVWGEFRDENAPLLGACR